MDCGRYKESLTDAAVGALPSRRQAELAAHLEGCGECRAALDAERRLLAAIDRAVAASLAAEPSPQFAARVRLRLAEESRPARAWLSWWIPVAAGALAVLAVVAVWLARRQPAAPGIAESARTIAGQPPPAAEAPALAGKAAPGTRSSLPIERPARPRGGVPVRRNVQPVVTGAAGLEVLVPPGQREAVLQLYEAVRRGRMDLASLFAQPAPLEPEQINIAPLQVDTLDLDSKSPEADRDR